MSTNTGSLIKQARELAGLTQLELAKRISTSPQNISQYERGLRNPKRETLQRIATALNIEAESLDPESSFNFRATDSGITSLRIGDPRSGMSGLFILAFEALTKEAQELVESFALNLLSNPKYVRPASEILEIGKLTPDDLEMIGIEPPADYDPGGKRE